MRDHDPIHEDDGSQRVRGPARLCLHAMYNLAVIGTLSVAIAIAAWRHSRRRHV